VSKLALVLETFAVRTSAGPPTILTEFFQSLQASFEMARDHVFESFKVPQTMPSFYIAPRWINSATDTASLKYLSVRTISLSQVQKVLTDGHAVSLGHVILRRITGDLLISRRCCPHSGGAPFWFRLLLSVVSPSELQG